MAAPARFIRRLRALQRVVRPSAARAVTLVLLLRLAEHVAPRLAMPHYHRRIPPSAQKIVDRIAEFLITQRLEEAAYYVSCVYAVLCDPEERRDLAMYFTPPPLARHIVASVSRETTSFSQLRFMDPACGGAAFLLPVVVALRDLLRARDVPPGHIIRAVNR